MTSPSSSSSLFAGRFELLDELGSGGQATVYRARDRECGGEVALKLFTGSNGGTGRRIARETERLRGIDGPRFCPILETGVTTEGVFLVMPVIEGRTLAQEITDLRRRANDPSALARRLVDRLALVENLARAVHELHERGLVHRDLKPANVMIRPDGSPVLLDFGLAVSADPTVDDATLRQSFAGSAAYMAPERITQRGAVDRRTDVFSLGAILFETATTERLFEGVTSAQVFDAIHAERAQSLRRFLPDASVSLDALILRSVARSPSRRPESALVFADDLAEIRRGRTVKPRAARWPARIGRVLRRRPGLTLLGAIALLVLLTASSLFGTWLARRQQTDHGERILFAERRRRTLSSVFLNMGEGSVVRAREALDSLLAEDVAPDAELVAAIGFVELVAAQPSAVRDLLDRQRQLVERHPELLLLRGNVLRLEGHYREANALDATIPPSTTATGHFIRGVKATLQSHSGDPEPARRAVAHLRHAIALESPAWPLHLAELVHAATHAGDHDVADRAAEALIERWPDHFPTWFWRGFSLRSRDPSGAVEAFLRALELDADADVCRLSIAECQLMMGDLDAARRIVDEIIAADPSLPEGHLLLAKIHLAAHEPDEAHDALLDYLELSSRSLEGLFLLADLLEGQRRHIESADIARRYLEAGGRRAPQFIRHLAQLDLGAGHFEESLVLHSEAHASGTHPAVDAVGLARALVALGRVRAAAFVIERELARDGLLAAERLGLMATKDEIEREGSRLSAFATSTAAELSFADRVRWVASRFEANDRDGARRLLDTLFDDAESEAVTAYALGRLASLLVSGAERPDDARAERARHLLHLVLDRWSTDPDEDESRDLGVRFFLLHSWPADAAWRALREASTGPSAGAALRRASEDLWAAVKEAQLSTLSRWMAQELPGPD